MLCHAACYVHAVIFYLVLLSWPVLLTASYFSRENEIAQPTRKEKKGCFMHMEQGPSVSSLWTINK